MIQSIIQHIGFGREKEPRVSPPQPVTPQAIELWKAVAPKRKPDPGETAVFKFRLFPEGVQPETPEQRTFLDLLRRYNTPEAEGRNLFQVTLSVNPSAHADVSLLASIWAPTPPKLDHPILMFTELPASKYSTLNFPYNMFITGEGNSIYTEACGYELMGFNAEEGKFLWQEADDRKGWSSNPIGDVEYRRKFAGDVLTFLTTVALTSDPVRAAERDKMMREALEGIRIRSRDKWRSQASFWGRLFPEPFYQPLSVINDNFNIMQYRQHADNEAYTAEYMRKYYPQGMQPSTIR